MRKSKVCITYIYKEVIVTTCGKKRRLMNSEREKKHTQNYVHICRFELEISILIR
jgi:hypothetical protein